MKKRIIFIISIVLFIIIAISISLYDNIPLDNSIYNTIKNIINPTNTHIFKIITFTASTLGIIIICLLSFIINKKSGILLTFNTIIITVINLISKLIFRRDRPTINQLVFEDTYSFPSGHTITATVVYGFIIYLIYKSNLSKKEKAIYISILMLLILLIGFSRIYLGVHYFTDVIGAIALGISYLIIAIYIIEKKKISLFKWKEAKIFASFQMFLYYNFPII